MAGNQDERRRGGEPPQRTATALWRLAPLFEPEQAEPASTPAGGQAAHVATAEAPSRTRWLWLLVAWTATLAVAGTLGFALGSARAERLVAFTIASRQCRRDADP